MYKTGHARAKKITFCEKPKDAIVKRFSTLLLANLQRVSKSISVDHL